MIEMELGPSYRRRELDLDFDASTTGGKEPVTLPGDCLSCAVTLYVGGVAASATVEATTSSKAKIEAGTAVWKAWPNGTIVSLVTAQGALIGMPKAIRVNVVQAEALATVNLSVVAQGGR